MPTFDWSQITEPTLLLDERRCRANLQRMCNKVEASGTTFRPHFKTHQSLEVGRWFKEYGVRRITVSSLRMAEYFAAEWEDITVAFPVNVREAARINRLAQQVRLQILVENKESLQILSQHLTATVGYFIKIDLGYGRTGLTPDRRLDIEELLAYATSERLTFHGFLGHAGHTYACRNGQGIPAIWSQGVEIMQQLKARYAARFPELITSLGDTPGCSIMEHLTGVDEVRPGNFIFYDLTQARIGSNNSADIAVALACPVVACHPERNEVVLYGGGVHFSKDRLMEEPEGTLFGRAVAQTSSGWGAVLPNTYLRSLSQEHGILTGPKETIAHYRVGDLVIMLPVHSCMTANLMKRYLTLDGRWLDRH